MALKAFCTTCQRNVYVEDGDTPVCPVCSSPLLETGGADDLESELSNGQTGGA